MSLEIHENHGKVTLNTIRRLYQQNFWVTLYKLIQKEYHADMAWIFRYLNLLELRNIFQYIQRIDRLLSL